MQGSRRVPLDLAHPGRVFIATVLSILAVDQLTKAVVRATLSANQSIVVVRDVFKLTHVHNLGAAFGLFPGGRPVFMLTTMLVLFVIAAFWRRAHPTQWPVVIALAFVTAGAVGNLIDRAAFGQVTDFFDFNIFNFPVFNVADSGIVVGVIVLMAWILFGPEPVPDEERPEDGSESADGPTSEQVHASGSATVPEPGEDSDS